MKEETWKPLPSLNGLLQVSNLGNVREYITTVVNGKTIVYKERYLTKTFSNGHYRIMYNKHGFLVARLVAEAFKKDFSVEKCVVYKDNDSNNLEVENLICVNKHEVSSYGEKNHLSKLKDDDILEICRMALTGTSCKQIANMYGINNINVTRILRKDIWKHIDRPFISLRALNKDKKNKEIIKFLGEPIKYKQKKEKVIA